MPPMSCRISSSCSASVSARSELPVYARMTAYMGAASFRLVYLESIGVSHDRAPMSRRKPQGIEVVLKQRHKHLRLRECCSYVKAGLVFSVLKTTRTRSRLRQRIASRRLLPSACL